MPRIRGLHRSSRLDVVAIMTSIINMGEGALKVLNAV